MKRIENKKLSLSGSVENYADLIMLCMNHPPQGGYDIAEMRKRIKVMDVVAESGDSIEFEDADFACVKQCVSDMRWGFAHKDILDFIDHITDGKKE